MERPAAAESAEFSFLGSGWTSGFCPKPASQQEMHIAGKETLAFVEVMLMNDRRSSTPSDQLPDTHCSFRPRSPAIIL
jgi:hypothetical protein